MMKSFISVTKMYSRKFLRLKVRNFLTVFNMGIGVALCLLIASVGFHIFQLQTNQLRDSDYFHNVEVYKDNQPFSTSELTRLSKLPHVKQMRVAKNGDFLLTSLGDQNMMERPLQITSIHREYDFLFKDTIIGREMKNENEIMLSELLVKKLGFSSDSVIGMKAEVQSDQTTFQVEVVGVIQDRSGLMFDPTTYQNVFMYQPTKANEYQIVSLHVAQLDQIQAVVDRLDALQFQHRNYTKEYKAAKNFHQMSLIAVISIAILLMVACIWVLNISLTISLDENLRFIALLKALGFKNIWIYYFVLFESVLFFLMSSLIGLAISGLAFVILSQIVDMSTILGFDQNVFTLHPFVFAVTLSVSFIVTVLFSIQPCRIASKVSVLEMMRVEK